VVVSLPVAEGSLKVATRNGPIVFKSKELDMSKSRAMGYLLGISAMLGSAGNAALAADYSGTLDFSKYSDTVPMKIGAATLPVDVGADIHRYDLGTALSGSAVDIGFTPLNNYDPNGTLLALLIATDPNESVFTNPSSLAGLLTATDANAFLTTKVTGWQSYIYGDYSYLTSHEIGAMTFTAGKHYYAFVAGGTIKGGSVLTDPSIGYSLSVNAVPEPESYAMMLAGLGLLGLMVRRRAGQATA
jgi:hypothetical protein